MIWITVLNVLPTLRMPGFSKGWWPMNTNLLMFNDHPLDNLGLIRWIRVKILLAFGLNLHSLLGLIPLYHLSMICRPSHKFLFVDSCQLLCVFVGMDRVLIELMCWTIPFKDSVFIILKFLWVKSFALNMLWSNWASYYSYLYF